MKLEQAIFICSLLILPSPTPLENMSTNIIYVVFRLDTAAPALEGSLTRPYFEWAEKILSDKAFTQTEDSTTNTYDVDEVEDASGEKMETEAQDGR
jgi:hypothetical protein